MLCGSGYFLAGWVRKGPPVKVAQGGLAGIDYRMPKLVPMPLFKDPDFTSRLRPNPLEFITCIQAIFMKLILFWHVKPFYKKYFTRMEKTRESELTGHLSLMFSKSFSPLSDDLVTRSG
ncbi:hypothetical protein M9H77_36849 [Catharanthus roseus]|uniref:Uncharacterized protein n=1 Tax=Catharanthus roseus TaxID=4058 RepID=A0ACB9ZU10_CATRO|nr:hypothetical protein M9H77_36849 [Catharanthus roseus]